MPSAKLDAIDRKILQCLQADGRMSLAELSAKVGLSASPCLRRVRLLEKAGIIKRYVAMVDQQSVGLPVSAVPLSWSAQCCLVSAGETPAVCVADVRSR